MPIGDAYRPAPRHLALGDKFFDRVDPARFPRAELRFRNQRWARRVGLDPFDADEWLAHFARFEPLPRNLTAPLALRYHGHQFGSYNPYLGDGRGFLFAQLLDARDGRLLDLGTKGTGTTPWSRGGDGRLTLKGGVREVLATEMLEALGVPTSKSFSVIETGERLERHDEPSPTRACVLVRLSHSHLRFGTFQRLARLGERDAIEALCTYALANYFPSLAARTDRAIAMFEEIVRRTATMCAHWMVAGFVHGVLNTDNMNITGESFDYGPYRFLPAYDPEFVAAYFDETGLYAFGRQPERLQWNLTRMAETLLEFAPQSEFERVLDGYEPILTGAVQQCFLERLGVLSQGADADADLVDAAYRFLHATRVGHDQFYFDWYGGVASARRALGGVSAQHYAGVEFAALRAMLERFEPAHAERLDDPYFRSAKPVSMLIHEIESIWDAIADRDDWSVFDDKVAAVRAMGAVYGRTV